MIKGSASYGDIFEMPELREKQKTFRLVTESSEEIIPAMHQAPESL